MDDAQAARELELVPVGLPPGLEVAWLGVSGYGLTHGIRIEVAGISLYDNFFTPLGQPHDFVARVKLAEVPRGKPDGT